MAVMVVQVTGQDNYFNFTTGTDKIEFGGVFNGGANDLDDGAAPDDFTFVVEAAVDFTGTDEALLLTTLTDANLLILADIAADANGLGVTAAAGESALIVGQGATKSAIYILKMEERLTMYRQLN